MLVGSDPKTSHRPCEGLRLALGLASGGHQVDLILANAAPLLLTEAETLAIDGEQAQKYLHVLKDFIPAVYIDAESLRDKRLEMKASEIEFNTILLSKQALALKLGLMESFFSF